jgi:hypothetical protein
MAANQPIAGVPVDHYAAQKTGIPVRWAAPFEPRLRLYVYEIFYAQWRRVLLGNPLCNSKEVFAFLIFASGDPGFGAVSAWTVELKDRHTRSNVLSPGPTETPLVNRQPPEAIARIKSTIPMGRMGSPEEIAKAALFLASDGSNFVVVTEPFVDDGRAQI